MQDDTNDNVDRPAHYCEGRLIEPIAVIEDWQLGFHLGNALKYIARAGRKGDAAEDMAKAQWYLKRAADRLGKGKGEEGERVHQRRMSQAEHVTALLAAIRAPIAEHMASARCPATAAITALRLLADVIQSVENVPYDQP